MLVLSMMLWIAAAAPAEAPLRLICAGHADAPTERSTLHFLSKGGLSSSTSYGSRREAEHVLFEMADGAARVHLPRALVTEVNSGGQDGWWKVSDLKVTDGAISGWFRINLVNKPSFSIDRVTGDIDLGGAYPFRGSCERTTQTERKF